MSLIEVYILIRGVLELRSAVFPVENTWETLKLLYSWLLFHYRGNWLLVKYICLFIYRYICPIAILVHYRPRGIYTLLSLKLRGYSAFPNFRFLLWTFFLRRLYYRRLYWFQSFRFWRRQLWWHRFFYLTFWGILRML